MNSQLAAQIRLRWRMRMRLLWIRIRALLAGGYEEIYYVGGSEALPPPLTRDEEEYLLGRLPEGDQAVRSVLIERNLRLVVYIARKFENTGVNIEDLVSIGTIGLIKAVNTFDPGKKIKLATYASRCIENEILMFLRRNSKIRTEVSFDEPLNVDWDGNELLLSDVLGTDADTIYRNLEEEVDRELLYDALSRLSDRERRIMELRFGLQGGREMTQKDVADLLGISQSYISRLEKRIIKRLQEEFDRMM
nr:RNA polymerase sporulation sigma factor SigE [Alicyclobacillus kakegawensis]